MDKKGISTGILLALGIVAVMALAIYYNGIGGGAILSTDAALLDVGTKVVDTVTYDDGSVQEFVYDAVIDEEGNVLVGDPETGEALYFTTLSAEITSAVREAKAPAKAPARDGGSPRCVTTCSRNGDICVVHPSGHGATGGTDTPAQPGGPGRQTPPERAKKVAKATETEARLVEYESKLADSKQARSRLRTTIITAPCGGVPGGKPAPEKPAEPILKEPVAKPA
ncbi:MAG: hypothetical protein QXQ79_00705 [Candidatus Nanoarchaeia archaeon]